MYYLKLNYFILQGGTAKRLFLKVFGFGGSISVFRFLIMFSFCSPGNSENWV
jgi:hypothetical protein